jgi:hypothetical protein
MRVNIRSSGTFLSPFFNWGIKKIAGERILSENVISYMEKTLNKSLEFYHLQARVVNLTGKPAYLSIHQVLPEDPAHL